MNETIEAFNIAISPYHYRIIPSRDARYYGWEVEEEKGGEYIRRFCPLTP